MFKVKRTVLSATGLFALAVGFHLPAELSATPVDASAPVLVILDTDLATDCDDAGAVAMLHTLSDTGEAEVIAMGVSLRNEGAVLALDAINTFFMRQCFTPCGRSTARGLRCRTPHLPSRWSREMTRSGSGGWLNETRKPANRISTSKRSCGSVGLVRMAGG